MSKLLLDHKITLQYFPVFTMTSTQTSISFQIPVAFDFSFFFFFSFFQIWYYVLCNKQFVINTMWLRLKYQWLAFVGQRNDRTKCCTLKRYKWSITTDGIVRATMANIAFDTDMNEFLLCFIPNRWPILSLQLMSAKIDFNSINWQ